MTIQVINKDIPSFVTNWWVNTNEPGIAGIANWHECWRKFEHYQDGADEALKCECGRWENIAVAWQEFNNE